MTWTYSGDPDTNIKQVRLLIGDTNSQDQLVTDKELLFIFDLTSDIFLAAADACDVIIAKLARDVTRSDIGMSASRDQQIQHYIDLRDSLRRRADTNAERYAGGLSQRERNQTTNKPTCRNPAFAVASLIMCSHGKADPIKKPSQVSR